MSSDVSSPESEIQKVEEDLMEATRLPDLAFLENIFSDKFTCVGSDGRVWGKEKAMSDFKRPSYKILKSAIQNRQITMHDNTAIVTGISTFEGFIEDKSYSGQSYFMRVWHKEQDIWRIIAVHINIPKSN
jgi:ketosteroid isomerase-like protein